LVSVTSGLLSLLARRIGFAPVFAVAVLAGGEAGAQSPICRQIEAELASLSGGGARAGGQYAQQAASARQRLARVQGTMASLGCNQGFVLFGPQPPAACAGLRAQAGQLQATIAQYDGASRQASAGNPQRRAQLMQALANNGCRGAPPREVAAAPQRPRGFFETLFGVGDSRPNYATETMPDNALPPIDPSLLEEKKGARGGPLAVCVRTCDGYFFPVNYQGARGAFEEICQASCPSSEVELYWMQAGGDLDTARSANGKAYTAMPNAFRYRQSYDPACVCKPKEASWAMALREAERIVRDGRNDITVTKERSNEMARPKLASGLRGAAGSRGKASEPAPNVMADVTVDGARVAGEAAAAETGERRSIRNVAPTLAQ